MASSVCASISKYSLHVSTKLDDILRGIVLEVGALNTQHLRCGGAEDMMFVAISSRCGSWVGDYFRAWRQGICVIEGNCWHPRERFRARLSTPQ
jgi:hypothetical protein